MKQTDLKIRFIAALVLMIIVLVGIKLIGPRRAPRGAARGATMLPSIAVKASRPEFLNVETQADLPSTSVPAVPRPSVLALSQALSTEAADVSRNVNSGCFTAKFKHPRSQGHQTREECAKHQNEIEATSDSGLNRAFRDKSSVCVKVDGNAVEFEKKGNRIVFGNIAGPDSVVTIRYCLGRSKCSDSCEPVKDSFMAAVGATEDQAVDNGQWDPSDPDEGDVASEFSDVLQASNEVEKQQLHSQPVLAAGWSTEAVTAGCGTASVSTR